MISYLNTKHNGEVETIDQLDSNDFNSISEFRKERKRLVSEYRMAGISVYTSQRCTNDWRNR